MNCVLIANTAEHGGGMINGGNSNTTLVNCTFSGNSAERFGGAFFNSSSGLIFANCIIWGNSPPDLIVYSDLSYCDFRDGDTYGINNIDSDPLFVRNPDDGGDGWGDDPATPEIDEGYNDDYGDLRLQFDSPCIDTGDNGKVTELSDLIGLARIVDGDCDRAAKVDMGAYEFDWGYVGDFAGGCNVTLSDFAVLAEQWGLEHLSWDIVPAGGDGIVNLLDLASFANNWKGLAEDFDDLSVFVRQWLESGALKTDIAPFPNGDGVVDISDFAIFAEHWLDGVN